MLFLHFTKYLKMKTFLSTIILSSLFIFSSCKKDEKVVTEELPTTISTFYLIRHAEKDRNNPEDLDPELNQDGLGRSVRWAEVFDPIDLDVIYTTNYTRTSMTAAPTAVKKGLTEQYYEPDSIQAESFLAEHEGQNVLIVGHSNTTPELVNRLLGEEKYGPMDDYDNSSLFIIRVINGKATDIRLKMD